MGILIRTTMESQAALHRLSSCSQHLTPSERSLIEHLLPSLLTPACTEGLARTFSMLDKNNDGTLSWQDFAGPGQFQVPAQWKLISDAFGLKYEDTMSMAHFKSAIVFLALKEQYNPSYACNNTLASLANLVDTLNQTVAQKLREIHAALGLTDPGPAAVPAVQSSGRSGLHRAVSARATITADEKHLVLSLKQFYDTKVAPTSPSAQQMCGNLSEVWRLLDRNNSGTLGESDFCHSFANVHQQLQYCWSTLCDCCDFAGDRQITKDGLVLGLVWEGLRKQQFEANGLTTLRSFTLLIEGFVISLESQAQQLYELLASVGSPPVSPTAAPHGVFHQQQQQMPIPMQQDLSRVSVQGGMGSRRMDGLCNELLNKWSLDGSSSQQQPSQQPARQQGGKGKGQGHGKGWAVAGDCDCGQPDKPGPGGKGSAHVCRYWGKYKCGCGSEWQSGKTWRDKSQQCKKCRAWVPYYDHQMLERIGPSGAPHISIYEEPGLGCQMCQELGQPCGL